MAEDLLGGNASECDRDGRLGEHEEGGGEGEEEEEDEAEARRRRKCCWCLSPRAAAALVCVGVSITNIFSMAVCIYLLIHNDITVYGYNEKFNYVFMITINAVMLLSNVLIIQGTCVEQQQWVVAWVALSAALLFLQSVVGVSALVLALVAHASAWAAVPFALLVLLDGFYIYCIFTVYHYCKTLQGYSVIP